MSEMAMEMCTRCDEWFDLDWKADEIVYIDDKAVCWDCLTEAEHDKIESEE